MAISQKVVFNNLHRTIIKFVSDGTATATTSTVTLASLAHTSSGFSQTVSGTPVVSIIGGSLSAPDSGTNASGVIVTRGANVVLKVYGQYDLPQSSIGQIKLDENASSDIVVTMSTDGTFFLDLRKDAGYTFGPNLDIV